MENSPSRPADNNEPRVGYPVVQSYGNFCDELLSSERNCSTPNLAVTPSPSRGDQRCVTSLSNMPLSKTKTPTAEKSLYLDSGKIFLGVILAKHILDIKLYICMSYTYVIKILTHIPEYYILFTITTKYHCVKVYISSVKTDFDFIQSKRKSISKSIISFNYM